ncbi:Formamidopyrimidine-DNA glycosylase [Desulfovibrionales bacterium]
MPELPEVETIVRGLAVACQGHRIQAVDLRWPGCIADDPTAFVAALSGLRIASVSRRGKLLLLALDGKTNPTPLPATLSGLIPPCTNILAVHLKMTGRLFIDDPAHPIALDDPHIRAVFLTEDESRLIFHDQRKFGTLRLMTPDALTAWDFFRTMGPEPLALNSDTFSLRLAGRRGRIKTLLLDQTVLAGIGNIYADESLFRAGIQPNTPANTLAPYRLHQLQAAIQEVLTEAIAACGSSIRNYRDAYGNVGTFQKTLRIYGRVGLPCLVCGTTIRMTKIASRTSTFCPVCQRN